MSLRNTLRVLATALGVSFLVLSSACALNLPPVRVDATSAELDRLTGEWVGEYKSDEYNGRSGSIVFILDAARHFAKGDVLMTPRGSDEAFQRHDPERMAVGRTLIAPSQSLTILFVRAENGELFGELDPYWDPDLRCEARTSFEGVLVGNLIRGTYETRYSSPRMKTTGRWQVTRLRDEPARQR